MNMGGVFHPAHVHFPGSFVLADAGVIPARLKAWGKGGEISILEDYKKIPRRIVGVFSQGFDDPNNCLPPCSPLSIMIDAYIFYTSYGIQ